MGWNPKTWFVNTAKGKDLDELGEHFDVKRISPEKSNVIDIHIASIKKLELEIKTLKEEKARIKEVSEKRRLVLNKIFKELNTQLDALERYDSHSVQDIRTYFENKEILDI